MILALRTLEEIEKDRIRDKIQFELDNLKKLRDQASSSKEEYNRRWAAFETENTALILEVERTKDEAEQQEVFVRRIAQVYYEKYKEKSIVDGFSVMETVSIDVTNEEKAVKWLIEKGELKALAIKKSELNVIIKEYLGGLKITKGIDWKIIKNLAHSFGIDEFVSVDSKFTGRIKL